MKHSYNIRLYRSPFFRIMCFIVFLCTLVQLILLNYDIIHIGFYNYFFGYLETNFLLRDVSFLVGCADIFEYILTMLLGICFLVISFLGAFVNKIKVRHIDILMFFPPRIFYRIYKTNIHSIEAIDYNSVSKIDRFFSFNFSKDSLYKITCYDTEFVICSKDDEGMKKLMSDINPRNNPRECDEENFDPRKFTKKEKIIAGGFLVIIFSIIQSIFDCLSEVI